MAATVAPAPVRIPDRRAPAPVPRVTLERRRLYETILQAAAARCGLTGDVTTAMAAMETITAAATWEASLSCTGS